MEFNGNKITIFDSMGVMSIIFGIALGLMGLGFICNSVSPVDDKRNYPPKTEVIDENYDRRYMHKNCVRICKSRNPLVWLIPY